MRTRVFVFFSGLALVMATIINIYLLPPESLVSSLYAIAVLIAALRLHPWLVSAIGGVAIALYVGIAIAQHEPAVTQAIAVFGLLLVTVLALLVGVQRRAIARRASEAEVARQQLQAFLGMVSHDLGQPLTSIQGYAQLLARRGGDSRPANEQRALHAIADAADRMRRLIADLRDASRIGAGQFAIEVAPCDLVGLVRTIVEEQQATTGRHALVLEAPERLEGLWDPDRLGQLCTNLIANAIAYTPDGGEVRVLIQCVAGEAWLSVRDRGIGIAAHERARLFQPFSRLTQTNNGKGSGLGLYISKAIVEAHGGRIWVRSDLGCGSTFVAALPLKRRRDDVTASVDAGVVDPPRVDRIGTTNADRSLPAHAGRIRSPHTHQRLAITKDDPYVCDRH